MTKKTSLTREEFEGNAKKQLEAAVSTAKKIRDQARLLETEIAAKELKVRDYQNDFSDLQQQLAKIQIELYSTSH